LCGALLLGELLVAEPARTAAPLQSHSSFSLKAAAFAVTRPLSELAARPTQNTGDKGVKPIKGQLNQIRLRRRVTGVTKTNDPVRQSSIAARQNLVTNPLQNFDGIDMDSQASIFGGRFAPPDTNADVGPNHVVMAINTAFQVYSKTGAALTPVTPLSTLFAALGPPWNTLSGGNDGDPIVLYDPLADRWLISEFGLTITPFPNTSGVTHQLIAISTTGDPTGSYFVYDFPMPPGRFNDYPHFGVWPDAYYMSDNGFNFAATQELGSGFYAFDRAKLLQGDATASYVFFGNCETCPPNPLLADADGALPTDIDGVVAPPAGTPNLFIEFRADEFGDPLDALRIYELRPNFSGGVSTLTIRPDLPVATFDAREPSSRANIDQPPPATAADSLDSIGDRLMHRLAYRSLPDGPDADTSADQSYVLNFTVNTSSVNPTDSTTYQGGVRWTELRRDPATGLVTVNQQATYAPGAGNGATGRNVWMASVAQDGEGNIGLAASASSTSLIPTAIYTGRLFGDVPNTMTQGEVDALFAVSKGVQTNTSNRWGDYSSLSVDPADECTFWGAFEYVDAPFANFDWNTRIFSFKVNPACVTPPKGSLQGQATNLSAGGAPLPGVSVTLTGGFFRSTDAAGNYTFTSAPPASTLGLALGNYMVTCSKPGFSTVTGNVTITANQTAIFNCALQGAPSITSASTTIVAEDCPDGRTDPGENITVSICVTNTGNAATNNLVGTLQATGGVTDPSGPQSYGVVAPGQTACRSFSFHVNPALACGSDVVVTISLQDGALSFGPFSSSFSSGAPSFAENFDAVTPPALPTGWTTNSAGSGVAWATSTTAPDTAPNAAFTPGRATAGESSLVSPPIAINSNVARLSFRHRFLTETDFDGGVLEIKIGAGAFTDILTAGGTFATGGYNGTLFGFSGCSASPNPLVGRQAWSGVSNSYITTTVNLPASLNGQTVQFRWRAGFDCSVSPAGAAWRVDSVQVLGDPKCCTRLPATVALSDPLGCTGPGDTVLGSVSLTNSTAAPLTGTVTTALPAGLIAISGSCTANVGACSVVNAATIVWTGTLAGGATLNYSYTAQVGDAVVAGTTLCATTTGSFGTAGIGPVQACLTINCPATGPGLPLPSAVPVSDQRAGSVLIYNIYTSTAGSNAQNTRISITNIEPNRAAFVHLFFVDGASCGVADALMCLTPNQTASFLASDLDPGTTGYLVAVATDRNGCPINFNYLIGDEYVKFSSGHAANLAAESVPAIAGGLAACSPSSVTATLAFDGVSYGVLPRVLAVDNLGSRNDGNDTLLVINSIGGDLRSFAAPLRPLFGLLYDDAERGVSFNFAPGTCQFRSAINNSFPRLTPRFDTLVPAGRSAWLKFWADTDTNALLGAMINFNPNAAISAVAFNQGHNLHKLSTTDQATLTIPIFPVACQ
jgi:hypothetical protein